MTWIKDKLNEHRAKKEARKRTMTGSQLNDEDLVHNDHEKLHDPKVSPTLSRSPKSTTIRNGDESSDYSKEEYQYKYKWSQGGGSIPVAGKNTGNTSGINGPSGPIPGIDKPGYHTGHLNDESHSHHY